jgi:3-dehydroquinate dehydratase/shikimate dehydrogenase
VQTTSAGMEPAAGVDPFPLYQFTGRELVYDLVYAPAMTVFLERARSAGCRIVQGHGMLLAQAGLQFRLFTGRALPAGGDQAPTHGI